jgi:hypothetical protein
MDNSGIYPYNSSVIPEMVAVPSSASKTITTVAVAIVNAAIKTYMRSPVAHMEPIRSTFITPIGRRP